MIELTPPQREKVDGSAYDAYEEDMAQVVFFFSKPVTTELLSSPRMTVFDFVASLGGILGLLMGVSFMSVIEWPTGSLLSWRRLHLRRRINLNNQTAFFKFPLKSYFNKRHTRRT